MNHIKLIIRFVCIAKFAKLKLHEYFSVYGISFWLTIGNEKSWYKCAMHFTINSFPQSITVVIITYDVAINMLLSTKMPSLMGVECVELIFGVIHNN